MVIFLNSLIILLFTVTSYTQAFEIGRTEPPFQPASIEISKKILSNREKLCDAVQNLADKSEMNYRLLGMLIYQKWTTPVKDKKLLTDFRKCQKIKIEVDERGEIILTPIIEIKKK